jgi:hypothetical protein
MCVEPPLRPPTSTLEAKEFDGAGFYYLVGILCGFEPRLSSPDTTAHRALACA